MFPDVIMARSTLDRVSIPYLSYGDGRINIERSGKRDDIETDRAEGAVLISLSVSMRCQRFTNCSLGSITQCILGKRHHHCRYRQHIGAMTDIKIKV